MHDKDDADVMSWNAYESIAAKHKPIMESKLMEHYNHRYATYEGVSEEDIRNGYPREVKHEELLDPDFCIRPRKWVAIVDTPKRFQFYNHEWILHTRKITNNIAIRTITAAITPHHPNNGSAAWIRNDTFSTRDYLYLLSIFNSFVFDYFARQKVAGINVNSYHLMQLPVPNFPSEKSHDLHDPIIFRAFELTYTAHDLSGLARDLAAEFSLPSMKMMPPFVWDQGRREIIRCEIDAMVAHLYGLDHHDLEWVLDAQPPSESFRVLKDAEKAKFGEFRTKRLVLEYFDRIATTSNDHLSNLTPAPGPPEFGLPEWKPGQPKPQNWPSHIHPPKGIKDATEN
jgi:hypothetical protein